ncbi:MAG: hypothetical protein OK456_02325 [Thaumarchaeota archaeon]|nr:hypothetical protein [Nitrososphaerota archaeon]
MLIQVSPGRSLPAERRPGIGAIVIAIALIAVIAVAGVAAYTLIGTGSKSTSGTQSSTQTSTTTQSSTTTSVSSQTTLTTSTSSKTSSSGLKTYSGSFNYSNPIGPFGELTFSNNDTVKEYTSVEVASGSFEFSINSSIIDVGNGTGHGTLTVTTTGFCSGKTTVPYTFLIPDVASLGGNITIFFGSPTPGNFTVPLTCTATAPPGSSNGDTFPYLSDYPGEISVPSFPATVNQHLSGNISYWFSISPTD